MTAESNQIYDVINLFNDDGLKAPEEPQRILYTIRATPREVQAAADVDKSLNFELASDQSKSTTHKMNNTKGELTFTPYGTWRFDPGITEITNYNDYSSA